MAKWTRENLLALPPIKVYRLLLNGEIKQFPTRFWTTEDDPEVGLEKSAEITDFLINEILKWDDETLKNKLDTYVFQTHKLLGMINTLFKGSVFGAINNAYPNKFKQWEFLNVPRDFWNEDTAIEATKWMIEVKLKWSKQDIISNISEEVFSQFRLRVPLDRVFRHSVYLALTKTYPNENWLQLRWKIK